MVPGSLARVFGHFRQPPVVVVALAATGIIGNLNSWVYLFWFFWFWVRATNKYGEISDLDSMVLSISTCFSGVGWTPDILKALQS